MIKFGIYAGILHLLNLVYQYLLLAPLPDETLIKYSLLEFYQVLGKNFNLKEEDVIHNSNFCLESDYFKLFHQDAIYEDVYCYRLISDTIQSSYKNACYSLSYHGEKELQDARKYLTMISNYPSIQYRPTYYKTRCLFTTNMGQYLYKMHQKSRAQIQLESYRNRIKLNRPTQKCLNNLNIIPLSFSLSDANQCSEIWQILEEKFRQPNPKDSQEYIVKSNGHLGAGVYYVNNNIFGQIQQVTKSGAACSSLNLPFVVQELVNDPVLIDGRKADFRLWVLIVQIDPLIIYIYEVTMVILCFDKYDRNNLNKYNFVCNGGVAKEYWKGPVRDAVDPLDLHEVHLKWTLEEWNQFLIQEGTVKDPKWWVNTLLPKLKNHVAYYLKINMADVPKDPRISGLFAFDVSVNRRGDIRLFDFNTGPNFAAFTEGNRLQQLQMHKDVIMVMKRYNQQRYTKIRTYIMNNLVNKMKEQEEINEEELNQVLRIEPIEEVISGWHYINMQDVLNECKPFDI